MPVSNRRLREIFTGWDLETADRPDEWTRDIYHERLGRELWWPLLIALLLLLIAESLAAAAGRAAGTSSTAAADQHSTVPSTARSLTG